FAPDRRDSVDVGLGSGEDFVTLVARLEVHRQRRAQIAETGMHFARDRAAAGAGRALLRNEAGIGADLVEIFGDGERVPDLHAVMGEAWDKKRRRQQQQLGPGRGIVARYLDLVELDSRDLA